MADPWLGTSNFAATHWRPTGDGQGESNLTKTVMTSSASLRKSDEREERPDRIFLSPPHMGDDEWTLLRDAFESNWIAPAGPHLIQFENELARYVGREHAVALSSCTAGLHLSLKVLGVQPGDEVLTSTLTFVATANAISYSGASPVFIDSDPGTWNLAPQLLEDELKRLAAKNKLPSAVMPVDLLGQCADYDNIVPICDRYEIPVIADAAESLGAHYGDLKSGSFGKIACFSFNGNKIITTSGGGMMVTDDRQMAEKILNLSTQARVPAAHYEHEEVGYNYRMSNLLAAVGRGQLRVLDDRVNQRRSVFDRYRTLLADIPGLTYMPEPKGYRSTRWLTAVIIDEAKYGTDREVLRKALEAENIESRPIWKPMHCQKVFSDCRSVGGDFSESLFEKGLCLPSGSSLTHHQQDKVIQIIRNIHAQHVRVSNATSHSTASDQA